MPSNRYRKQWRRAVEQYAFPTMAELPIDKVGLDEVRAVLQPIWHDKSDTASKQRQRIETVLSYATVTRYRTNNNAARWRGNHKLLLAAPTTIAPAENYASLQIADAPRWWERVKARDGMGARALKFQAMTATHLVTCKFLTARREALGLTHRCKLRSRMEKPATYAARHCEH